MKTVMTPKKALDTLRAYFPKADGHNVTITCLVADYNFSKEAGNSFHISAWKDGDESHLHSEGPTLQSALALILEGREPVQTFTEDPDAYSFFKQAEEDAEGLRLAGAKVEQPRFYTNDIELWKVVSPNEVHWLHSNKWKPSIYTHAGLLRIDRMREITTEEALAMTGGAL